MIFVFLQAPDCQSHLLSLMTIFYMKPHSLDEPLYKGSNPSTRRSKSPVCRGIGCKHTYGHWIVTTLVGEREGMDSSVAQLVEPLKLNQEVPVLFPSLRSYDVFLSLGNRLSEPSILINDNLLHVAKQSR